MAMNSVGYDISNPRQKMVGSRNPFASRPVTWRRTPWTKLSPVASVLGISAYFLLLGSVAVVVITEQFPWFIVAPVTILLTIAYFWHVEATEARRLHPDLLISGILIGPQGQRNSREYVGFTTAENLVGSDPPHANPSSNRKRLIRN